MSIFLEKLREAYVPNTPHMRDIGLEIDALEAGRATMSMGPRPEWLGDPGRGLMHPGPLTVLADSCAGLAVVSALTKPTPIATLDLRMDYLRRAGPDQKVHCEAHCVRMARNVAFVNAEVWQEDRGQLIAIGRGAFMLATSKGKRPPAPGGISAPEPAQGLSANSGSPWEAPDQREPASAIYAIPYADYLGIRISRNASGTLYRMPYQEKMIGNPRLPALHGGVVAGFSETAALLHVIAQISQAGGAKFPKSIDFSIDYLRSARPQETFASCDIVRIGSRIALVQVRCWQTSPEVPITVSRVHLLLSEPE